MENGLVRCSERADILTVKPSPTENVGESEFPNYQTRTSPLEFVGIFNQGRLLGADRSSVGDGLRVRSDDEKSDSRQGSRRSDQYESNFSRGNQTGISAGRVETIMPKVIHVKKARKAKRKYGIKKGKPYWFWGTRIGGRFVTRYSLTKPKPSDLTNSEFWSAVYRLQERVDEETVENAADFNALLEDVESELEEIRDDVQSKFDNMPEPLQEAPSGQTLQSRIDALESVDLPDRLEEAMDADEGDEDEMEDRDGAVNDAMIDLANALQLDCE